MQKFILDADFTDVRNVTNPLSTLLLDGNIKKSIMKRNHPLYRFPILGDTRKIILERNCLNNEI